MMDLKQTAATTTQHYIESQLVAHMEALAVFGVLNMALEKTNRRHSIIYPGG